MLQSSLGHRLLFDGRPFPKHRLGLTEALTQIVEHPSFKALNKADEKYGHYLVNANIHLLVKYSSPSSSPWQFTFNESDLDSICDDIMDEGVNFFRMSGMQHRDRLPVECRTT